MATGQVMSRFRPKSTRRSTAWRSPSFARRQERKASGAERATDDNLPPENYQKFAIFLATIAKHAQENWGITFTSVEPFNESHSNFWAANGRQEGCHFSHPAQAAVVKVLRAEMDERGLREVPIPASDESWYDWAVETWNSFDDSTKGLIKQVNVHGYQGINGRRDLLAAHRRGPAPLEQRVRR
jgi:galactan endo-1,6-beta-galactosidase